MCEGASNRDFKLVTLTVNRRRSIDIHSPDALRSKPDRRLVIVREILSDDEDILGRNEVLPEILRVFRDKEGANVGVEFSASRGRNIGQFRHVSLLSFNGIWRGD